MGMRAVICMAAAIVAAGCTTKTIEREVHYVSVASPLTVTPAMDKAPPPPARRQNYYAASLAFCGRIMSDSKTRLTDPHTRETAEIIITSTANRLYDIGIRPDDQIIDDGIKRADFFLEAATLEEYTDVLRECIKIGDATTDRG